jgi:Flp pilus assembly protein TadD
MCYANKSSSMLILTLLLSLSACGFESANEPLLRPAEPDRETASFKQARQLIDQGKAAEAITAFRSLLRAGGPSLSIMNGLAVAHAELGRPDLAADFFAKALALAPGDPATLNNIGYAALRRRETGLARHYLEMAEQAGDDAPEINGNLNVLERLEASRAALIIESAARPDNPVDKKFAVQRKTTSTVRLARLGTSSGGLNTPQRKSPPPSTALIDFSELFDPWLTNGVAVEPSL